MREREVVILLPLKPIMDSERPALLFDKNVTTQREKLSHKISFCGCRVDIYNRNMHMRPHLKFGVTKSKGITL